MRSIEAVRWGPDGQSVRIIDQRRLPQVVVERDLRQIDEVCDAIATLAVRGAPAIGLCAAMGLVAALAGYADAAPDEFRGRLQAAARRLRAARPTAVNLGWAIDRMLARAGTDPDAPTAVLLQRLREEATRMLDEDRRMCRRIGEHGLALLPRGARVLTHCNAGALATGGIGTALAPVYLAAEQGHEVHVLVTETRPLLQGARLTVWELRQAGIDVTLVTDSMAGSLMRGGRVDLVMLGADRIAANGDVANKIGTYPLAVLAHHHGIPFYVAAPTSTLDPRTATGEEIEIEQRAADEVRAVAGHAVAPGDVPVWNPAFDVTPASLVTAIVTDRGVWRPPYDFANARLEGAES